MNWYKKAQNSSIKIRTESVGSHHGQSDLVMIASIDNNDIATLEFSVFNQEPYINMIKVKDSYRRQGIATKLMKELQREYPDTEIHMGMSTEDGTKLLQSLPSKFIPNERYNELLSEKNQLEVRIKELQIFLDTYDPKTQKEEAINKGEEFNIISDRLYDIEKEMEGLKAGKNILEI
jgi:predicted GNAT family acetyltransferase